MVALYVQAEDYVEESSTSVAQLSGYGTIKFIEAVRERPEVWDSRSTAYKSKDVKQQAWKCIASVMDPNYFNLNPTEQNLAVHSWMRRWKSLRDCYTREVGRNAGKKRKYIYFDHLTFLNDVIGSKRYSYHKLRERAEALKKESYNEEVYAVGELWNGPHGKQEYIMVSPAETPEAILSLQAFAHNHREQEQEEEEEEEDDEQPQPVAVFSLKDDDDDDDDDDVTIVGTSKYEGPTQEQDDAAAAASTQDESTDRMFLLSLISDLKRIPNHKKLQVKSKILAIIQEALDKD